MFVGSLSQMQMDFFLHNLQVASSQYQVQNDFLLDDLEILSSQNQVQETSVHDLLLCSKFKTKYHFQ